MGWGDIDVGDVKADLLLGVVLNVEDDFIDNVDEIFKSGSDFRVCVPAFQHDVIPEDRTRSPVSATKSDEYRQGPKYLK